MTLQQAVRMSQGISLNEVLSCNPALIQSHYGIQGNFELVVPLASGGMAHFFRNNDAHDFPWYFTATFGTGQYVEAVSLIESNFGAPGNLEVVARVGDQLHSYYRNSNQEWQGPFLIPTSSNIIAGNPVLIQSHYGKQGNFELVVPLATGGIAHFFRDNDAPGLPWRFTTSFGAGQYIEAVSLIESNFGTPGNLEIVARVGDQLYSYYRDQALGWQGPFLIPIGGNIITGNPVLIQGHYGKQGNFELVVPVASGGMAHFFRDNDLPGFPWHFTTSFGTSLYTEATSLIESNFNTPGNLEVVVRSGDQLCAFYRDQTLGWQGPFTIVTHN